MNKSSILGGIVGGLIGSFLWNHLLLVVIVGSFILYYRIGVALNKGYLNRTSIDVEGWELMIMNLLWPMGFLAGDLRLSDGFTLPKVPFKFQSPIVKSTEANNE